MKKSKYLIHMHAGRSQTTLRMLAATLLLWSSIAVAIQYEYKHPAWDGADPEHDYTDLFTSPGDYSNLRTKRWKPL